MIYHEELELKNYDSSLIRRILSYVKPYWLLVSTSLLFLLLATGGQLILPVIIQRTVDENLRPSWVRGDIGIHEEVLEWDERVDGQEIRIASSLYYPENAASAFFRTYAGGDNFQLYFLIPRENVDDSFLPQVEDKIELSDTYIAISEENYKQLSREEKNVLRIQDWKGVQQKVLGYFFLLVAVLVFGFLQMYLMSLAGQNIMKDLRLQLYAKTSKQNLRFLQGQQVGRLVTRVSSDVETINELFTSVLSAIVADAVMMVGVIFTLFVLNPRLGLVSLVILPPVCILLVVFQKKARGAYRKVRSWVSAVNAYLSEHFSGVALVQAFVREKRVMKEFEERNSKLFKANLGELYVFAVFRPLVDLLATLSIALIIYAGANALLKGLLSLGVLIAFINLIERFYMPVRDMAEKFTLVQSALAGGERVFSLLDEDHLESSEGNAVPTKIQGALEFDNVHFSYIPGEPVLRGISLSCKPGERLALVGHTGSGKTTITNIITRLWECDSGTITIDGIDIQDIPPQHLRGFVQTVQQDVSLFHLSLRDNLLLGREMDDEEIFSILNEVEAGDFVRALPEGLDTMVSENASNFSVGQLQLLSFARLLIQNPRIVIMDEATASIDTQTEKKVQHAMDRMLSGRTSIVIAHRLSTIMDADRILVLNKGQVVESGSHNELMDKKGLYHTLQEIQNS